MPESTGRPSHDALMRAQEALGEARNIEQDAGNAAVARLLNQLVLTVFQVSLRADLDELLASTESGGQG